LADFSGRLGDLKPADRVTGTDRDGDSTSQRARGPDQVLRQRRRSWSVRSQAEV